jgi:uncharacterized protein YwgA
MQIQKTLFVIGEMHGTQVQPFYDFQAYHYGPFSIDVEEDLKELREEQLVDHVAEKSGKMWEITRTGLLLGENLSTQLDDDVRLYLLRLTKWVSRVPQAVLLRAIYERFPEYRRKGSVVLDP